MIIAVTGASGQLGALVIQALVERGVQAPDIVAIARTPGKVSAVGVTVRTADYEDPNSLDGALEGVDRLLLVSGSEIGKRLVQHRNVIDAAVRAGVSFVAYTSLLNADTSTLAIADEHRGTEEALVTSGLPFTVLRNGWYMENYTAAVDAHVSSGFILGAAGEGRIAAATRRDFAEAAASVLLEPAPGRILELGGPGFTLADFARAVGEASGRPVEYRNLAGDALVAALQESGVSAGMAQWLVATDASIADGALDTDSTELAELLGRRPAPLPTAVSAALGVDNA